MRVAPHYIAERSSPEDRYYFFAYTVHLSNESQRTLQLLSRFWRITDGDGEEQEVSGPGVVGKQPVLTPGAHFEYTSFCPLRTEVGSMAGHYTMRRDDETLLEVQIPSFTLALPHALN